MSTFITQSESVRPNPSLKNQKIHLKFPLLFLLVTIVCLQSWSFPNPINKGEGEAPFLSLTTVGAWSHLTLNERHTLSIGGVIQNFDIGICNGTGQSITAEISSGPASAAPDPSLINAKEPRRWGNTSFYLARQNMGGAGVQYCFELSEPSDFVMDSREHAYFTNFENIVITASNAGTPVILNGSYPVSVNTAPAELIGNGTTTLNFNANGREKGGLWWQASSNGLVVTEVCIQYFSLNPGELPSVEPFRFFINGDKCIADAAVTCDTSAFISRWNRLNNTDRANLDVGTPVHNFNTGFCDESGDAIHFLEISSTAASSAPFSGLNNREPRPYGEYSLDNGREYIGMGGNTYCFTLDDARPMRVNSKEHSFFTGNEQVIISAFLGADPVILSGFYNGTGGGAVAGTLSGIQFNGADYGAGFWWEASSGNQAVSQICVEYVNIAGAELGREPFALEICAERCIYDDRYACSQNPAGSGPCTGLPDLQITKNIYPSNEYGLNACGNPGGGTSNAYFDIEISMKNHGGTVKELWLEEDLLAYFGTAYVDTVTAPEVTFSTASGGIMLDPDFDGRNFTNIFSPSAGFLQNGQEIVVSFTIELNLNAPGVFPNLINTAYGGGIGNGGFAANDLSGGLSAGDGYPTLIPNLPIGYTTVEAQDLTLEATLPNFMNGINAWLADNGGAEFNVPDCDPVNWTNDYDSSLSLGQQPNWVEGCGQITGSIEVTFFGTDACGNVFTTCATFTLEDTEGPSCTKPEDLTLNCADPSALQILEDWLGYVGGNWTDLSHPVTFTNDFTGLTPGACSGDPILVMWTATDACGNESFFEAFLTVIDNEAPVLIGVPPNMTAQICDDLPDPASVTATDGCDLDVEIIFTETTTGSGCNLTILREWTATDDCGNFVSGSQTITVTDNIAPVLSGVPPNESGLCMGDLPPVPAVTANDNCDDDVEVIFEETQTGSGCDMTVTRTWTATDDCGNSASASQTITVGDTEVPTFTNVPTDITVNCEDDIPPPPTVTANDNCDDDLDVNFEEAVDGDMCQVVFTRTWTATDDCGNETTVTRTVTVVDQEAPVLMGVPADITVMCPDIPGPATVTATDNCTPNVFVTFEEEIIGGPCPAPSQIIRTWTADDGCGNVVSAQQIINVEEMFSEIIFTFVPADVTATCDENPMFGEAIAETTCPAGGLSLTFEDEVISTGDCSQPFSVVRTFIAHDACGNHEEVTQTLNIGPDTEAPIFAATNPVNITVDCGGDIVFPVAFDNCGPTNLTYEDTNTTGDCATGFMFTRTWTATDLCGNTSTFSQEVTTNPDTAPPVFTFVPFDQFFDCDEDIIFPDPVAVDNCSEVTITFQDSIIGAGECQIVNGIEYGYDIIRTWIATDECGNFTTAVTSSWVLPGFAGGNPIAFSFMPADQTIECGDPSAVGTPVCHSVCSEVTLTYEDQHIMDCDNGHSIVRTWTATDLCGNEIQASHTVHFGEDTNGPLFTYVPPASTSTCTGGVTPNFGNPSVEDDCVMGLEVTLTHSDVWQNLGGCEGSTVTRTWTAVDVCGNESTASQTITLVDEQAPVFTIVPADVVVACGENANFGSVSVSDNCSDVSIAFVDETAAICESTYTVTRTWTASDLCGNSNTASQTITFEDNEAPVFITAVSDQTIQCGDPILFSEVEAIDGCSSVNIEFEDVETPGCESTITRTWTATDACGHSAELSQTITVVDTDAPVFDAMLSELSMTAAEFADWQAPVGNVSDCGTVEVEMEVSSLSNCEAILHSYLYTATDACGNEAFHQLDVTILDAVFSATTEIPVSFECGNHHDLIVSPVHGSAPFTYEWQVMSGIGWEITSGDDAATASVMAGEGSAEILVSVMDANDCAFEEQFTVECSGVSAVRSESVESFSIFPNPATDFLTVRFDAKKSAGGTLFLLNTLGEVVTFEDMAVQNGRNERLIDIFDLTAGTYILQLRLENETVSERFVKLW